jgi:hypothetical protein
MVSKDGGYVAKIPPTSPSLKKNKYKGSPHMKNEYKGMPQNEYKGIHTTTGRSEWMGRFRKYLMIWI